MAPLRPRGRHRLHRLRKAERGQRRHRPQLGPLQRLPDRRADQAGPRPARPGQAEPGPERAGRGGPGEGGAGFARGTAPGPAGRAAEPRDRESEPRLRAGTLQGGRLVDPRGPRRAAEAGAGVSDADPDSLGRRGGACGPGQGDGHPRQRSDAMTWWKGLIAGVLLLAVVGITVAGLRDRPPPATEVQMAKVKKGTISRVIIGAGKVEASTTVKISSNLSGDLVERPVELGDKVKKGQVLGRIDPRPFVAAAKQAQASVSAARADVATAQVEVDRNRLELERVQGLAKRGMASGAEVDKAKADYNGAAARVGAAQQRYAGQVAALDQAQTNL